MPTFDPDSSPPPPPPTRRVTARVRVVQSQNGSGTNDRDSTDQPVPANSGSEREEPAEVAVSSDLEIPPPGDIASGTPQLEGPNTSTQSKNAPGGKPFRPTQAKTDRFVFWPLSPFAVVLTKSSGLAGREWADVNPEGSKEEFEAYFKNLSAEERQVCGATCRRQRC